MNLASVQEKTKVLVKLSNSTTAAEPFFVQRLNIHNQSNSAGKLFSVLLRCAVTIPPKIIKRPVNTEVAY